MRLGNMTGGSARPASRRRRSGRKRLAGVFLLVVTLGACEVGPDYHRPATTLGPFHEAAEIGARSAAAAPRLDAWWTGFGDPVLTGLIQRAMTQNLDLAASLARVRQGRAAAQAASARLLPTLDANGQATELRQSLNSPLGRIGRNLPGYRRDQRLYDVGAAASWEIDLFGGLQRGEEAAAAEAQAAQADLDGTRVTVAGEVGDAYFQIRGNQARIGVAEQQISVDVHLLSLIRQLHDRGLGNDREVSQAEALLDQAQASLPPLRILLEAQSNRLDVLLGVQPGTSRRELAEQREIVALPAIPDAGQPTDFLRRRPDVAAAERRLAAANAGIGVAISDYYPKLSLSGLLGFDGLSANHLLRAASFEPAVTGAIRWRIFDFGKVDAEVGRARGRTAEALAQYRLAVLRAAEDVEDAFKALVESKMQTKQLLSEVQSLQRSRALSQQAFAAGAIPLTDVLDADRQLLSARDDLARTQADSARAAVQSFRALGGGWSG